MGTYKTPGVYVEEISTLPASIAPVETAIPAFIGYTEMAKKRGKSLRNVPTKVSSFVEFKEWYGGPPEIESIEVDLDSNNQVNSVTLDPVYHLYNSMQLFYDNGGGDCYVVSIGDYSADVVDGGATPFTDGLTALRKYDEPTLILFPDAVELSAANLATVQQQALLQCAELQDRFTVMDLRETIDDEFDWEAGVAEFRNNIGINNLKYGAAYTPHLEANLDKNIRWRYIDITQNEVAVSSIASLTLDQDTKDLVEVLETAIDDFDSVGDVIDGLLTGDAESLADQWAATIAAFSTGGPNTADVNSVLDLISAMAQGIQTLNTIDSAPTGEATQFQQDVENAIFTGGVVNGKLQESLQAVLDIAAGGYTATFGVLDPGGDDEWEIGTGTAPSGLTDADAVDALYDEFLVMGNTLYDLLDAAYEYEKSAESTLYAAFPLFRSIWDAAKDGLTTVPPSGAVVGQYTAVDNSRGVWKAPANVSLNSVSDVTFMIDHDEQEDLNVDTVAGKSINAIRPFTGKGILIWGARTLAGNDNEWRYVPVRRFYNFAEESIKKATEFVVFEPNDANTWTRVRSMITNFLTNQWRAGALAGKTPDDAFFVNIGLGETMTSTDILEGRMIVEIGMAVVRPAEFIILRFSHKLQES